MKHAILAALLAAIAVPSLAAAQTTDKTIQDNPGYKSGSADSVKSGMDSSRGVPTSPTAGRPGTVDNGDPKMTNGAKSR